MNNYYPSYYNDFSCLAGECPDSCCRKWEIIIDDNTLNKYKSLNTSFGEKLLSAIITDEEGECCFKLQNKACPFLNKDSLCDIHITLGEEFTSEICRKHPRFTEEYDGFAEISLSLSCPEANRLITLTDNAFYPSVQYDGDDEVLELLISSRKKLLESNGDFSLLIKTLLDTAADDSLDIDLTYIENHPEINTGFLKDFGKHLLSASEILTDEWRQYLKKAIESTASENEFISFCIKENSILINICRYFIYRYYLKAVNDLDIYSRALLIASASCFSALIAFSCRIPLSEAARLFSKEAEHNTFNTELILKYFSKF